MRGLIVLSLFLLLVGCSMSEQTQVLPQQRVDLTVESYSYSTGGYLLMHNVHNERGEEAELVFRAECGGLPFKPWSAVFESNPVSMNRTGAVGYWLRRVEGVDPATVGGPVICGFEALELNRRNWTVETGGAETWLPVPEPEERPREIPGVPLKPRGVVDMGQ